MQMQVSRVAASFALCQTQQAITHYVCSASPENGSFGGDVTATTATRNPQSRSQSTGDHAEVARRLVSYRLWLLESDDPDCPRILPQRLRTRECYSRYNQTPAPWIHRAKRPRLGRRQKKVWCRDELSALEFKYGASRNGGDRSHDNIHGHFHERGNVPLVSFDLQIYLQKTLAGHAYRFCHIFAAEADDGIASLQMYSAITEGTERRIWQVHVVGMSALVLKDKHVQPPSRLEKFLIARFRTAQVRTTDN